MECVILQKRVYTLRLGWHERVCSERHLDLHSVVVAETIPAAVVPDQD